jgi:hypothetical protein
MVYGRTPTTINGLNGALARPGLAELKIGGVREDVIVDGALVDYRYDYFTVANISTDLGSGTPAGQIASDMWRLGVAWEKGYGYLLWDADFHPSLTLYKTDGVLWSRLRLKSDLRGTADGELLGQFDGTFRFGTKMEAGVKLHLAPLVVFDAGFERSVVFRRHIFWPWVGSVVIEGAGQWLLDRFVDRVLDSSPGAAPVVNFLLKNGVSFAAYQLRRERMYAPFESEPPLFVEGFKMGISLEF